MKKVYFILIIIIVVSGIIYAVRYNNNDQSAILGSKSGERQIIYLNEMFYELENFSRATKLAEGTAKQDNIYSIVIPHHLLASEYIAELIKMSSGRDIDTVVIIGPNHENIGSDRVATVKASWDTPLGLVETNEDLVDNFAADFKLKSDYQVFANEHSVGAIVPFVKYYLPQAKILPIVFSSYAGMGEAGEISQWLIDNLPPRSLVIISTDFSHYLTKQEADRNDDIIQQLILERDIEKIVVLNNDYVDSPVSLVTALMYAEENDLQTEIIHNSNSFDFSVIKPTETTSYFAITFWR